MSLVTGDWRLKKGALAEASALRDGWAAIVAVATGACLLSADPSRASGFAIREQSASALGNAYAGGAAAAEDPSYMFYNPAALARQDGHQILTFASFIRPVTHFDVKSASTQAGIPITGGNGGGDVTDDHIVPALYAVVDLDGAMDALNVDVVDNVRVGLAVTVPYGLETDYKNGWAGRYHALQSKLRSVNLTPTVAFDIVEGLSIGAGLQAQYMDAELSNAIDFGSIAFENPLLRPIASPTQQDGKARVEGDDWGFGWTLGALYEPWTGTRFGVGFRSHIRHELKGDARFNLDSDGVGRAISGATGAFTNTGAKATVETPESLTFGVYQDIDQQWSVMANASWTGWSRIKELRVRFDNPAQPDSVTDSDWKDTWFVAAGSTYRPTPSWAIRLGAAYDQSPVPNRTRTPSVPDSDRYWLSLGASYAVSDAMDFTIGYAHIFTPDASVRLKADQQGSATKGNLSGNVDASVDIVGLQFRWVF